MDFRSCPGKDWWLFLLPCFPSQALVIPKLLAGSLPWYALFHHTAFAETASSDWNEFPSPCCWGFTKSPLTCLSKLISNITSSGKPSSTNTIWIGFPIYNLLESLMLTSIKIIVIVVIIFQIYSYWVNTRF